MKESKPKKPHSPLKLIFTIFTLIILISFFVFLGLIVLIGRGETYLFSASIVWLVFITVLSLAACGIICIFIFRQMFQPVIKISQASSEIAKGNFDVTVSEKGFVPEIRELAANFNQMSRDLQATDTLRNDFISSVSHEFKTPLSAIGGYATLLQNQDMSKEEINKYTSNILFNTRRLTNLTENILSLTRLENTKITDVPDTFRLDEQLRQVIVTYEQSWSAKNINLDLALPPITYTGYRYYIAQVWSNLIENAIKFTPQNGSIKIECEKTSRSVIVTIADNGIGISPEDQKYIFQKFFQGDSSHHSEGNGLGLALVKEIVELCHGKISVTSELEKGTQFKVELPVG